mgnify:FL=1
MLVQRGCRSVGSRPPAAPAYGQLGPEAVQRCQVASLAIPVGSATFSGPSGSLDSELAAGLEHLGIASLDWSLVETTSVQTLSVRFASSWCLASQG